MSGSGLLGGVGLEWALWCDDDMTDNGKNPQLQQSEMEVRARTAEKSTRLGNATGAGFRGQLGVIRGQYLCLILRA